MKKILIALTSATILLAGCGKNEFKATETKADEPITIKITTLSVPNDAHTKALNVFKDKVEEYSKGTIKADVYHSGSLFGAEEEFPALLKGNVDICYMAPSIFADYIPEFSMFSSAYLFKDYDHMRKVFDGEIGKELFKKVNDKFGITPLSAFYLGSRELNLRDDKIKIINSRSDLKGIKLRMPNSDAWLTLGKSLGANPTPLAFSEVYLALKTGTIDAQDNPLPTVKNAKFYEVTKSIILTHHLVDTVWPCISKQMWNKLTDDQKKIVKKAINDAKDFVDNANLTQEKELVDFFKKEGLKIYTPDLTNYIKEVQQYYLNNKDLSKDWNMEMYKKIQNM